MDTSKKVMAKLEENLATYKESKEGFLANNDPLMATYCEGQINATLAATSILALHMIDTTA